MFRSTGMYKTKHDQRPHRPPRAHKLEQAREDHAILGNVDLSRVECGILALDRLIRRIA